MQSSKKTSAAGRLVYGVIGIPALAVGGYLIFAWRDAIAPIEPPTSAGFDVRAVQRGAQLAALGACATCHTAPGGPTLAGGRAVITPFGVIYSTNISPDPDTGIGRWSQAAFVRAMREGVDREGQHLYPAFPYDHFTLVSDADDAALYAFLMTRQPISSAPPPNRLPFPLNQRLVLAAWKLLFFRKGPYATDPAHDAQWNRGAYLANGLGHCGACHTPRNQFGAERTAEHFNGADAEGWHAYAINSRSEARVPWDKDALHAYLRDGWHTLHGDAHGPMAPVARNLASLADSDLRAISTYVAWVMGNPVSVHANGSVHRTASADASAHREAAVPAASTAHDSDGAAIYESTCASCHDGARALPFGGIRLSLSTAVTGESPTNLINVVLEGIDPPEGAAGAIMPGFAGALSDSQMASLMAYVRASFAAGPPWLNVPARVREARGRDHD